MAFTSEEVSRIVFTVNSVTYLNCGTETQRSADRYNE